MIDRNAGFPEICAQRYIQIQRIVQIRIAGVDIQRVSRVFYLDQVVEVGFDWLDASSECGT